MSYAESILHLKTVKIKGDILVLTRFRDFSVKIEREGKQTVYLNPNELLRSWIAYEYGEEESWAL